MKHLLVVRPSPSHFNGLIQQSEIWCISKPGCGNQAGWAAVCGWHSCGQICVLFCVLWMTQLVICVHQLKLMDACRMWIFFFFFLKLLFPWALSLVPLGSVSWTGLLNVDSGLNTHVESTEHTDHLAAGKRCYHIAVCHCCYALKA